jgi:hypothetical protein
MTMTIEEYPTIYDALAAGDPDAVRRFAPRVASLAAEARKSRALAPKPLAATPAAPASRASSAEGAAASSSPTPVSRYPNVVAVAAPPRPPSRAATVAEIHLAGVNATRKSCKLPPLSVAELASEYADLNRLPPARTKLSRREGRRIAANLEAARQGNPTTRSAIDEMWSGFAS